MRKVFYMSLLIAFTFSKLYSQKTEAVLEKEVKNINTDDLRTCGYNNTGAPLAIVSNNTKQPISNTDEAAKFLQNLFTLKPAFLSNPILSRWMQDYNSDANHCQKTKIIVFIQHPLDLKKLYQDDINATKAKTKFIEFCNKTNFHSQILDDLTLTRNNLKESLENKDELIKCQKFSSTNSDKACAASEVKGKENSFIVSKIKEFSEVEELMKIEVDLISKFSKEKDSMEKVYNGYLSQFVEKEAIESFFLNKEKREWSKYALEKRDIMFVILGGQNDFAKYKIKINNKTNNFQSNLNDLKDLSTSILGNLPQFDAIDCSSPKTSLRDQEIPISFNLLNDEEIVAPSAISFNDLKDSIKYSFDIHEKVSFGIKVGISAALLNRKQFTISADNQLTVQLDDDQKKEWKSNLMALVEWYPFGRDIDRFESIFSKDSKTQLKERIGITTGIRISKDPIQDIYGGISLALSKDFSLGFGIQYHSEPKDQSNLPVGIDATLEYLKSNVSREYKVQSFFALLINPGVVSKLLGLKSK
ncbi:hypothetical protein QWZ08_23690 [Ferruginibacter paludis]|uniref:hypothetical protein n=1 Tax=Ferruginibacter paludis TaxID=1310417 RepID=UPI0025B2B3B0|nr:hypothetical protein [Ferruginibacter paludis]MDN3658667.1 hypothetical protein [Ferruginibacter paludis]